MVKPAGRQIKCYPDTRHHGDGAGYPVTYCHSFMDRGGGGTAHAKTTSQTKQRREPKAEEICERCPATLHFSPDLTAVKAAQGRSTHHVERGEGSATRKGGGGDWEGEKFSYGVLPAGTLGCKICFCGQACAECLAMCVCARPPVPSLQSKVRV